MSVSRSSRLLILIALVVVIGGLAPAITVRASNPSAAPALAIPDTPAGTQLTWALDQINGGAGSLQVRDVTNRFADDFLAGLPAASLIGVLQNLAGPLAPVAVARFEGGVTATRVHALLSTATGQIWRVQLGVEPNPPYRINDLFFEPVALPQPVERAPSSWKGLNSRLQKVAPEVSFVAAEVNDGTCKRLAQLNPDQPLAIASSFKLYVLGALAHQIELGNLTWDDPLTIQANLKSLPSGDMRLEPDGAQFPIRTYADLMISNSDNTAADHLISLLGRETVEQFLPVMGHHEPELDQPLLLTREWFAIKLRFTPDQLASYLKRSEASKRSILSKQVDPLADTLADDEEWINPTDIDSIEWFASAGDLCRAIASLQAQATKPGMEPVADALSLNPGVPWDTATWRYVGYKGGYETGVRSYVWLLQRADGRWFAVTAIINDTKQEIDGNALRALMVTAVDLLAKTK
jgi:beta-lactamase class A